MQTAAIPYRVADFLKQHPPFQYMDEPDLIALSARGRVKFHEPDEYICWQASAHSAFISVIQQGSVALWDESVTPPALRDIRGAGDVIGIERFNGMPNSLYSAKAASEVVIYALQAADFEPLLARYPLAAQYVAASSAVTADYCAPSERPGPHEMFLVDLMRGSTTLQCLADTPIQQAARHLAESGQQAIALVKAGELVVILTTRDIVGWVAAGAPNPSQPACGIAKGPLVTMLPDVRVSDCVLAMARADTAAAALTSDGSAGTAVQTIVTASNLVPAFGDHPLHLLREIASAPGPEAIRAIHDRARRWILDQLTAPVVLDWLLPFADLVNRRILQRLLQITPENKGDFLWCFLGAAGRQELLTAVAPRLAVIGEVPDSLVPRVAALLDACGYLVPEPVSLGTLAEWEGFFSGWIHDPINTQVYESRPVFDLQPVCGPRRLFDALDTHVRREMDAEPMFLRLLAHDCLSNLPPLTFFRDLVVEESGEHTDTFRLEESALQPLADVARVFGLAAGHPLGASTRTRFEQARHLVPSKESVFREASETMRLVLFHQARAGLRLRSNGADVPLSLLSRHDRQVLKSGFRSIHNLLQFTAPCDWLEEL